jgi:hypothetical protein
VRKREAGEKQHEHRKVAANGFHVNSLLWLWQNANEHL